MSSEIPYCLSQEAEERAAIAGIQRAAQQGGMAWGGSIRLLVDCEAVASIATRPRRRPLAGQRALLRDLRDRYRVDVQTIPRQRNWRADWLASAAVTKRHVREAHRLQIDLRQPFTLFPLDGISNPDDFLRRLAALPDHRAPGEIARCEFCDAELAPNEIVACVCRNRVLCAKRCERAYERTLRTQPAIHPPAVRPPVTMSLSAARALIQGRTAHK